MTALASTSGSQGDPRVRPFFPVFGGGGPPRPPLGAFPPVPLSGRQGAQLLSMTCVGKERPVDTVAGRANSRRKQP